MGLLHFGQTTGLPGTYQLGILSALLRRPKVPIGSAQSHIPADEMASRRRVWIAVCPIWNLNASSAPPA